MKFQNPTFPIFIIAFLMILVSAAYGQVTIYNNFGQGHDGWDYNYGLGWTIAGYDVASQYGVEQAMGFESTSDGYLSDIWLAISYVPMSSPADTVIIRLCENPNGLPPDTADIMEEWMLTGFSSWNQWNAPIHLQGNLSSQLVEGHSYWLWAIAKETTWTMWCMNEDGGFTCPHTIRREDEEWLGISNETAGVFRVDVSLISEIEMPNQDLAGYSLSQNFPNPFNQITTISYSIADSKFVQLKVYDLFGREVQTLVNEFQQNGNYSLNFEANQLPVGIYIYKLQIGEDLINVMKMSVQR